MKIQLFSSYTSPSILFIPDIILPLIRLEPITQYPEQSRVSNQCTNQPHILATALPPPICAPRPLNINCLLRTKELQMLTTYTHVKSQFSNTAAFIPFFMPVYPRSNFFFIPPPFPVKQSFVSHSP